MGILPSACFFHRLAVVADEKRALFLPQRGRIPTRGQRVTFPALLSAKLTGEEEFYPFDFRLFRRSISLIRQPPRGADRRLPSSPAGGRTFAACSSPHSSIRRRRRDHISSHFTFPAPPP